ncbi:unannotated protein [freshwater metagenome]|uniref:Unannotated protein n=1 Tax=freshwater metagenome TaxID=449393 RepID=A0A6J6ZNF7_9ZZZZ
MAADRRPGNLAHLERLLNEWSRDNTDVQATAGRLRRLVAISVLATILDGLDQGGAPRLALKGGASMEIRFGVAARASRDVDALVNVSLDDAFAEIGERLNSGWEGFTGKLTERTEIIRAGITPAPQRCTTRSHRSSTPVRKCRRRVPIRASTTSTTSCCSPAPWRPQGSLKPGGHARTPSRTAARTRGNPNGPACSVVATDRPRSCGRCQPTTG